MPSGWGAAFPDHVQHPDKALGHKGPITQGDPGAGGLVLSPLSLWGFLERDLPQSLSPTQGLSRRSPQAGSLCSRSSKAVCCSRFVFIRKLTFTISQRRETYARWSRAAVGIDHLSGYICGRVGVPIGGGRFSFLQQPKRCLLRAGKPSRKSRTGALNLPLPALKAMRGLRGYRAGLD